MIIPDAVESAGQVVLLLLFVTHVVLPWMRCRR
jgi:hypothetical protein